MYGEERDPVRDYATEEVIRVLSEMEIEVEDRNGNYTWVWLWGVILIGSVIFSYATTPGKTFDAWTPINLLGGSVLIVVGVTLRFHNRSFLGRIRRAIKIANIRR